MCSYARLYIDKSYPSLSLYLYVELKSSQFSGNALKKSNCNFGDCGFCNNALYALFSLAVSMGKYCAVIVERNVANSNSVRKKRFIRFIVSKNIITRSLRLFLFHYVRSCQKNQKVLLLFSWNSKHCKFRSLYHMNNFRQARNSLPCPFHNYRYVWQCHYDRAHYLHTIDKLIEYLFPLFSFFLCFVLFPHSCHFLVVIPNIQPQPSVVNTLSGKDLLFCLL